MGKEFPVHGRAVVKCTCGQVSSLTGLLYVMHVRKKKINRLPVRYCRCGSPLAMNPGKHLYVVTEE